MRVHSSIILFFAGVLPFFCLLHSQGWANPLEKTFFGIHVGSFRDADRAAAQVRLLEESGFPSSSTIISLPGQGEWHRVFAGYHGNRNDALEQGELLRKKGVIDNYSIIVLDDSSRDSSTEPGQARLAKTTADQRDSRPEPKKKAEIPDKESTPVVADSAEPLKTAIMEKAAAVENRPPVPETDDSPAEDAPVMEITMEAEKTATGNPSPSMQQHYDDKVVEIAEISATQQAGHRPVPPWSAQTPLEKNPAVAEAMDYFRSERYGEALKAFRAVQIKGMSDENIRQFIARRVADCVFMLAMEGSRSQLMAAIDGYREILNSYSLSKEEIDEIRLQMAEGYHSLGLYHESLRELNGIIENPPPTVHLVRALYLSGLSHYRLRGYERSIESFREYLRKYPSGEERHFALMFIGDSYSQREQFVEAESAFNKALSLWPSIEALPQQELIMLGSHYLRSGADDKGLQVFMTWINLYPASPETAEVLCEAARILAAMDQVPAALALLRQVMERYPETRQAVKSMLVMADLGLRRAGMSLPRHIFDGMEYYLDPILAFDDALKRNTEREGRNELLFLKTGALIKLARYREAFESALQLQVESPWSPYRNENIRYVVEIAELLINGYHEEGDHLAAANVYLLSRRHGLTESADFESLFRSAMSLDEIGLNALSRSLLERLNSRFRDEELSGRAMLALASIDLKEGLYDVAEKRAGEAFAKMKSNFNPQAMELRELLGDGALRNKDYDRAESHYAVLAKAPTSPENKARVLSKYGDTLRLQGGHSQAITQYERAIMILEKNNTLKGRELLARSYEGIAECYHRLGQYKDGIQWYSLLLDNANEEAATPWGLYRLGQSYARLSNRDLAVETFNELKERPGDPFWQRVADYGQNYEMFRSRHSLR